MKDLGYTKDDLLVCSTEGGETPWVIGCVDYVLAQGAEGKRRPFFLYCNPDEVLVNIERSRRTIFDNKDKVHSLNLFVGNMGITGSTRM